MSLALEQARPLAPLTTLGLGGAAKWFVEARDRESAIEALRWAAQHGEPARVLGGGSNLVVADAGVDGLVVRMATRGIALAREADHAVLTVEAGEPWENVVGFALDEALAGLECLVGIPGSTGATPIQNVGAYGQEVSDSISEVEVLDRASLEARWLPPDACSFAYRDSRFKHEPDRHLVLAVRFRLRNHGVPTLRYPELLRALGARGALPSLREVADTVRALRAAKSMLLDPNDENHRSAGSFFMNPIVPRAEAVRVQDLAVTRGMVQSASVVPCYDAGPGRCKLAAGWLIEQAGIHKGFRRGPVGVSSRHALALVHHGGGSTRELLALASEIQGRVAQVFGIQLEPEPVRWG